MTDDIDTLLRRHGRAWQDDFTPPPSEPMLERATTPDAGRHWWPALVAAVLILAVPIGTVIAVHRTRTVVPASNQKFAIPDSITVNGKTLERFTSVPWADAVISTDGLHLTVRADTWIACKPETVRIYQTGDLLEGVSVTVEDFRAGVPNFNRDCLGQPHTTKLMSVTLATPLAGRPLNDPADFGIHSALPAQSMPQPTYLPAGYGSRAETALTWDEKEQTAVRLYSVLAYKGTAPAPTLTVTRVTMDPNKGYAGVGGRFTVLGRNARVLAGTGAADRVCLNWIDSTFVWNVCSSVRLPNATMVKIANSLR